MRRSLRFSALTIALGYIAVSLIVLLLFATPILYAWKEIVAERSTELLPDDARRLQHVYQRHGEDSLRAVIDTMVEGQPVGDEKFILLADKNLLPLEGNLQAWPRGLPLIPGTYTLSLDLNHRSVPAIFVKTTLPGGFNLIVGRNMSNFKSLERLFWLGLIGAGSTVLVFAVFGGLLIRRALLAEVHGINLTVSAIIAGDLSRRLVRRGDANELDILAQTINRMLDQIEQLIHGIRNVSNAIAHDLRTPLTELRARLEELGSNRPPPTETFIEIDGAVGDVDRVIAIFNALLRLAEIDNGARRSGFVMVDVAKVVSDAVDFYQPLAEFKGLTISFQSIDGITASGDPLLLAQAIGNLIDNSIKYAVHAIRVNVAHSKRTDQPIAITVSDDGPGIPDAEKVKVIERFYRRDSSRGTPGIGLGLSLVAAVAKLHGGNLNFTDARPGLNATLFMFPASAELLNVF